MRLIDADRFERVLMAMPDDELCEDCCYNVVNKLDEAPAIEAEPVVRCKDCKWWDKKHDSPYGYCHACKHGHRSEHWEINIYRIYKGDWYCADGERKDGGDA